MSACAKAWRPDLKVKKGFFFFDIRERKGVTFSLVSLQNNGWRVQEETCLLFARTCATAALCFII